MRNNPWVLVLASQALEASVQTACKALGLGIAVHPFLSVDGIDLVVRVRGLPLAGFLEVGSADECERHLTEVAKAGVRTDRLVALLTSADTDTHEACVGAGFSNSLSAFGSTLDLEEEIKAELARRLESLQPGNLG